jgi:DNA-binding IclR family transcriptional regulator
MSLTKICQALGIRNSKGHYILSTLKQYGLVNKDPDSKTYMLGPGLIPLARSVLDHLDFRSAAAPVVEELARQVNATVYFGLRMRDSFFVLNKYEAGGHFWATPGIGQTFNFYEGAHGKAALAFLSDDERELVVEHGKGMRISQKELSLIRAQGFANDYGKFFKGINAIAAPVFGAGNQLVGVLLLFGTFDEKKANAYGPQLVRAATRLSQRLGNHPSQPY